MTCEINGSHHDGGFSHHRGPVTCAAGIPGTRKVITSGYDSAVGIFDLEAGTVELLGYHDHLVNRIVVNEAGTLAASSSSDYTIRLWDLERGRLLRVLYGHSDDVEDFAFIDDTTGASASAIGGYLSGTCPPARSCASWRDTRKTCCRSSGSANGCTRRGMT